MINRRIRLHQNLALSPHDNIHEEKETTICAKRQPALEVTLDIRINYRAVLTGAGRQNKVEYISTA